MHPLLFEPRIIPENNRIAINLDTTDLATIWVPENKVHVVTLVDPSQATWSDITIYPGCTVSPHPLPEKISHLLLYGELHRIHALLQPNSILNQILDDQVPRIRLFFSEPPPRGFELSEDGIQVELLGSLYLKFLAIKAYSFKYVEFLHLIGPHGISGSDKFELKITHLKVTRLILTDLTPDINWGFLRSCRSIGEIFFERCRLRPIPIVSYLKSIQLMWPTLMFKDCEFLLPIQFHHFNLWHLMLFLNLNFPK